MTDGSTPETGRPPAVDPDGAEAERPVTPPKKLPLPVALFLLLLIPAIAMGIWFGGRLHRIDDRPPPKPARYRVPAMAPATAPTMAPATAPTMAPTMAPATAPTMAPTRRASP